LKLSLLLLNMVYKKYYILLFGCVVALFLLSFYSFHPKIEGDSVSYIEAIEFLTEDAAPTGLIYNRIITTFGGLTVLIVLGPILDLLPAWQIMNFIFFAISAFAFFKLLDLLFENRKVAILGTLFLIANYAILRFGLAYLMDMGGWAFYISSVYFTLKYSKSYDRKNLYKAVVLSSIGGLFKEYAFLAVIPIVVFLVYENWPSFRNIFKKSILPALLAVGPIFLVYLYAYIQFDYTYFDWLSTNQAYYLYDSRIIEYIKSLGSLLNILGILFVGGLLVLRKQWQSLEIRIKLFLLSIFASFLPIFFWPAITQRILFITVPFTIIISGFLFKKYENRLIWLIPAIVLYLLVSLTMDSYILPNITLPV